MYDLLLVFALFLVVISLFELTNTLIVLCGFFAALLTTTTIFLYGLETDDNYHKRQSPKEWRRVQPLCPPVLRIGTLPTLQATVRISTDPNHIGRGWYTAKLVSGCMYFYEQTNKHANSGTGKLSLDGCKVKLVRKEKGFPWTKDNYLMIESTNYLIGNHKSLCIWFMCLKDMEEWYFGLERAVLANTESNLPCENVFAELQDLLKPIGKDSVEGSWFTALIHRVFWNYHSDPNFLLLLRKTLQKKFNELTSQDYANGGSSNLIALEYNVKEVKFGANLPEFQKIVFHDLSSSGSLDFSAFVQYCGGFSFSVELVAMLAGATFTGMADVKINHIEGDILVYLSGPPCDKIWFGFTKKPLIKMYIELRVGESHKVPGLGDLVKSFLRRVVTEKMVTPNMDCIPFPQLSKKYEFQASNLKKPTKLYHKNTIVNVEAPQFSNTPPPSPRKCRPSLGDEQKPSPNGRQNGDRSTHESTTVSKAIDIIGARVREVHTILQQEKANISRETRLTDGLRLVKDTFKKVGEVVVGGGPDVQELMTSSSGGGGGGSGGDRSKSISPISALVETLTATKSSKKEEMIDLKSPEMTLSTSSLSTKLPPSSQPSTSDLSFSPKETELWESLLSFTMGSKVTNREEFDLFSWDESSSSSEEEIEKDLKDAKQKGQEGCELGQGQGQVQVQGQIPLQKTKEQVQGQRQVQGQEQRFEHRHEQTCKQGAKEEGSRLVQGQVQGKRQGWGEKDDPSTNYKNTKNTATKAGEGKQVDSWTNGNDLMFELDPLTNAHPLSVPTVPLVFDDTEEDGRSGGSSSPLIGRLWSKRSTHH
eukprot:TRINITY_DN4991_c0_g2_i1.p1 TRINITY_DN4991_c0_g2~~TRINITY_DN4991_c0_g2_i1.p1  ORF type:complete len:818 (+),score=153.42 TRINITY_DN4991_c0_g2_i1:180-2633(+)